MLSCLPVVGAGDLLQQMQDLEEGVVEVPLRGVAGVVAAECHPHSLRRLLAQPEGAMVVGDVLVVRHEIAMEGRQMTAFRSPNSRHRRIRRMMAVI